MKKIILVGCGGHAKSVTDAIESAGEYQIIGFIGVPEERAFSYRGYKSVGTDRDLERIFGEGTTYAFVCVGFIGEGVVRNKLYGRLKEIGYNIPVIKDPTAAIASDARIGEGAFIGKNAVVNSCADVGNMAIINTSSVVEHDCVVGEFSHVSVGAVLCGAVNVGENTFIGANSTVIQGLTVASNAIVGAGSTVLRDVMYSERAVGVVK
ncbi:MAG: acetyltransferase [Clostridiales bacterium]|nr:acetyltransferase [Clostridiales bacterium]